MTRRSVVLVAVVLATALSSAAAQDEPAEPKLKIAFIAKSYANPVFVAAHRGAQDAAKEYSTEKGIPVEVLVLTPTGENPAQQAERIAKAVEDGAQAIAIAASEAAAVSKAIDEAVSRGVEVMTFDVDLPDSKRFAYYGTDNENAGEEILEELSKLLGGAGKVAILAGNPDAPNLQQRVAGVKAAAQRHPGLEIVGVFHHVERSIDAAAEVLRVNEAHPDLKGWAMVGGWPMFESARRRDVLKDMQARGQKVVAVDALPEQLRFVDAGVAVLLGQPVYEWGTVTVSTIVDKLHFHKDVSGTIPMKLVRVSYANLEDWAGQLRDWGFRGISEEYLPD
ncbi:MAG: substrate-binding domain-containing protein [Acidobacteria bacterium]|jgi:ribose transport system substrate-binding protein|nr:substrate-binding domain-containing protein [Acidobacteriota bacterium]